MEAKLIEKCRNLALAANREYRGQHQGCAPTQEVAVDFDPIWATPWTALVQQGATADQEDDCRQAFIEGFYQLASSGGGVCRRWRASAHAVRDVGWVVASWPRGTHASRTRDCRWSVRTTSLSLSLP